MTKRAFTGIVLAALAVALAVCVFLLFNRKSGKQEPQVSAGRLDRYPSYESVNIAPRTVSVWLPEGFQKGGEYAAVYMHDGQMLFDANTTWNHQEWRIDEVLGELISAGKIRPCIVVAIDNTPDRLNELFPQKTGLYVDEAGFGKMEPKGDAYLRFIVEEVMPFVQETYEPLGGPENTFIMGSSMGGLISLYAICEYPEVFGGAVCMSSHLSMEHLQFGKDNKAWAEAFVAYLNNNLPETNTRRIYMDHGTVGIDSAYGQYQDAVDNLFKEKGWDEEHFLSLVFEGHDHNETCWSQRLHEPIEYILDNTSHK